MRRAHHRAQPLTYRSSVANSIYILSSSPGLSIICAITTTVHPGPRQITELGSPILPAQLVLVTFQALQVGLARRDLIFEFLEVGARDVKPS
jgi:hypothetical protein